MVALGVVLAIVGMTAAALAGPTLARLWRRQMIARRPFPAAWRDIVRRRVPLARELPAAQHLRLKKHIQVLLAEVPFIGCAGLEVSDEMRVTIAAQAAFLLLGRGGSFGNLREVLVYPGHFVVPHSKVSAGGVVHEGHDVLAGQSWQRGQVLVAWDAVLEGAADPHDGANVVIHEFAHQLDQDTGAANGAPYVGRGAPQRAWASSRSYEPIWRVKARGDGRLRSDRPRPMSRRDNPGQANAIEGWSQIGRTMAASPDQADRDLARSIVAFVREMQGPADRPETDRTVAPQRNKVSKEVDVDR